MTETRRYSILITDDDRGVREALQEIVENQGFRPVLAADGDEALAIVQSEPIHLALLDLQMPKLSGLETLQLVRQINALLPAILITADATLEVMRRAFEAHFFSVVPKPVNANVVKNTVVRALIRVYGPVPADEPLQKPDLGDVIR
ncbi:response regulator [Zavarzinella formosa]|uniref:response regulator n=1 Tax=Zavarzinella formosa TaxID=360055 RepID=UPI0002F012EA|nr:response regulator [Zavarzinella formosa]